MTEEQLLQKIMDKAEKGGWVPKIQYKMNPMLYKNTIIFTPDFGKAYYGKEPMVWVVLGKMDNNPTDIFNWQYHQHQMLDELQAGRSVIEYMGRSL